MTKIYLISPPKIIVKDFAHSLQNALKTGLVPVFQLRLKDYERSEIKKIAQEIKKICHDNNCLFLLNDYYDIALEVGADGVHLGSEDKEIITARKNSAKNFIIGASCYDSRDLAIKAAEQGADYLSFGTFFLSQTKNSKGKPTTEIIEWCVEMTDLPVVAIGGINDKNCHSLVSAKVDFLSVVSYVWNHPSGEAEALRGLDSAINAASC